MNLFKYLMPVIVAMGFVANSTLVADVHHEHEHGHSHHDGYAGYGQDRSRYLEALNQRDWDALRDFISAKRQDDQEQEDECDLTISGDVRSEWRNLHEKGINQEGYYDILRGGNAKKNDIPVSNNDFDIEFNLRFDYICDKTWAVSHLKFDNSAGVDDNEHGCECDPAGYHGSGNCDSICLMKAYMGYNIYECHDRRLDVELGRMGNLYNAFESRIEFLSRFDGIIFKFSDRLENISDWYWNTAGFVIDERVNHFGWVTEMGFLDIADSGIDFKYSFIDWQKHGKNRCGVRDPEGFNFLVSQWYMAYHFDKSVFGTPAKLYGAYLRNHANTKLKVAKNFDGICEDKSEKRVFTGQNNGWYVGFTVGEVVHEGDFAFNVQYEWVQATAMPDEDAAGIGNGNVLNNSVTESGRGNTNYKGVKFEFLFALSDNISIDSILEFSKQIKKSIGGRHRYSKFELEAIYAF